MNLLIENAKTVVVKKTKTAVALIKINLLVPLLITLGFNNLFVGIEKNL